MAIPNIKIMNCTTPLPLDVSERWFESTFNQLTAWRKRGIEENPIDESISRLSWMMLGARHLVTSYCIARTELPSL
jgi:hypothetical protein